MVLVMSILPDYSNYKKIDIHTVVIYFILNFANNSLFYYFEHDNIFYNKFYQKLIALHRGFMRCINYKQCEIG